MSICYLNGVFLPLAEARVPVLDRGFIFGDAVYEVIPVAGGHAVAAAAHVTRLAQSLAAVTIANPLAPDAWLALIERIVADNGGGDQSVYVQVTRGVAERDHAFPRTATPTVLVMSKPLAPATAPLRVAACVLDDNRWGRCDIKSTSLLPNVLLRNEAIARDAYEAILVRDGRVTEGAASNVFVVAGGVVRTPPLSSLILPGVTRALLLEMMQREGIACAEMQVSQAELEAAEEIWLTSSTRDLMLVNALDGRARAEPAGGALADRVYAQFQLFKRTP